MSWRCVCGYRRSWIEQVTQLERITAAIADEGRIGVRFFDLGRFPEEMRLALDIYNEGWRQNWGFIPVSEREANQIIEQLAPVLPAKAAVFALADGNPAALLVALPNLNEFTADIDGRTVSDQLAEAALAIAIRQDQGSAGPADGMYAALSRLRSRARRCCS